MSRLYMETRRAVHRPHHKPASLSDLNFLTVGSFSESRSLQTARPLMSRQEGASDDVQHLLCIIDSQRAALEERAAVIKALQKDVNTMGKMLVEERKRASHYCKMYSFAESELDKLKRKHATDPLSPQPAMSPLNFTEASVGQLAAERSPLAVKSRKFKRKMATYKPTRTLTARGLSPSMDFQDFGKERPLSKIAEMTKTIENLQSTLDTCNGEVKALTMSEEHYLELLQSEESKREQLEKTISDLKTDLETYQKDKLLLEEQYDTLEKTHSEVLISVELFRKRQEDEQLRLKKELALMTDTLNTLRSHANM